MARRMKQHKVKVREKASRSPREFEPEGKASAEQIESYSNRIKLFLRKAGGRPVSRKDLAAKTRGRGQAAYLKALRKLTAEGVIVERRNGYVLAAAAGMIRGTITRLTRSMGYARPVEGEVEYAIFSREMRAALPGDTVLLRPAGKQDGMETAEVVQVIEKAPVQVSGLLMEEEGQLKLLADAMFRRPVRVLNAGDWQAHLGEKAIGTIRERGEKYAEHGVEITVSLGAADSAKNCAAALAAVSGAPIEFPAAAMKEAEKLEAAGITDADIADRLDLRGAENGIFTIDGAGAKDLDDAISIEKTETGYRLGVHIADVSHYVKQGSALDAAAIERGTSVYYADQVIPMLPKALSNGICSLHPDVDRLCYSALMELDENGELVSWKFRQTVIRSLVKGVYAEVNQILAGEADAALEEKYAAVKPSLLLLDDLREKRLAARMQRGAPSIEAEESALILDEAGICVDVAPRTRGKGEELIEECMLLANEAAARVGKQKRIPFVYRVHAVPPPEKAARLAEILDRLQISHPTLEKPKPRDYARILKNAEHTPLKSAIHQTVLRSMAKADYETEPVGHFGLALADYTHFTSPIRRYPDLAVHRLMKAAKTGQDRTALAKFAKEAAIAGSMTEQRALQLERDCDDRYLAEWARGHLGERYTGVISGVTEFGLFVMLPNTVEGMVLLESLPADEYTCDGFTLVAKGANKTYMVGDACAVVIAKADVNSGRIDFTLQE